MGIDKASVRVDGSDAIGVAIGGAGASMLALASVTDAGSVGLIVGALVMQGIGMGMFYSPNASAVLSTVERERYGIATAFMNMVRNTASVTGLGLATVIVTATMGSMGFEPTLDLAAAGGGAGERAAFTKGLQTAYFVLGGLLAFAIVLSLVGAREKAAEAIGGEADRRVASEV